MGKVFDIIPFEKILSLIVFYRSIVKYGSEVTEEDILKTSQEVNRKLQNTLSKSPGPITSTSSPTQNKEENEKLEKQLDPKSTNPQFYRGFKLSLEYDKTNTLSLPLKRVKGVNAEKIILYSLPPHYGVGEENTSSKYSFTNSTQVLVEELKFNIDQYINSL